MLSRENEMIEDRETQHGAGRHHDRDAIPYAQTGTVLAAEFALERFVETQETESLQEQASCIRGVWRRIFRERHTSEPARASLNRSCFVCVRRSRRKPPTPQPWTWVDSGRLLWGGGDFTRVRQTSSGLHACLRTASGEIPSSFAAGAVANSSRGCSV